MAFGKERVLARGSFTSELSNVPAKLKLSSLEETHVPSFGIPILAAKQTHKSVNGLI
jgi:hypothetical protein